jgi:hypothetical protein
LQRPFRRTAEGARRSQRVPTIVPDAQPGEQQEAQFANLTDQGGARDWDAPALAQQPGEMVQFEQPGGAFEGLGLKFNFSSFLPRAKARRRR